MPLTAYPCDCFLSLSPHHSWANEQVLSVLTEAEHIVVMMYTVDFLLHEGQCSREAMHKLQCPVSGRHSLRNAMISHGPGKHDHTAVLLASKRKKKHCKENKTSGICGFAFGTQYCLQL